MNYSSIHRLVAGAALAAAVASPGLSGQSPARVVVEASSADVEIAGGAGPVEATATVDGRSVVVGLRIEGDTVVVEGDALHGSDVRLRITAPRAAAVEATRLGSGSISVTNMAGALDIRTRNGTVTVDGGASVRASSGSGNVSASNVSGPVELAATSGDVMASRIGSARVSAGSGNVIVETASGAVTVNAQSGNVSVSDVRGHCRVSAVSGNVTIRDVAGDAQAKAASGRIDVSTVTGNVVAFSASDDVSVRCAGGSARAESASGDVRLQAIGGDVDASSASGNVFLTGRLRASGRYSLKSVSGDAVFSVVADPAGFTASLSSFTGDATSEFVLTTARREGSGPVGRRLEGTFGDGSATVTLNAFSGTARIARASQAPADCGVER